VQFGSQNLTTAPEASVTYSRLMVPLVDSWTMAVPL